MKKEYQKPEIELISLLVPERIAFGEDGPVTDEFGNIIFPELDLESSIFW